MENAKICGCFYVNGELQAVEMSRETERRAYDEAARRKTTVAAVFLDAHRWAREGGVRELTEALFLQYLKAVKR